jgi:hypothetical protein
MKVSLATSRATNDPGVSGILEAGACVTAGRQRAAIRGERRVRQITDVVLLAILRGRLAETGITA